MELNVSMLQRTLACRQSCGWPSSISATPSGSGQFGSVPAARLLGCSAFDHRLNVLEYTHRRLSLRGVLIAGALLLFAQLGAELHAYSHDATLPGAAGRVQADSRSAGDHGLCAECLAFAPLLAAAGTPTSLPPISPLGHALAADSTGVSLIDDVLTLAFRARAPPAARRTC